MKTKVCFKCHKALPKSQFYKHPMMADGTLGKCKECTKKDSTIRRIVSRDEVLAYDRMRSKRKDRRMSRRLTNKQSIIRNPEKQKARNALSNAVRDGKVKRLPCQVCGNRKSEGHHHDYSKPLDVQWLCVTHHREKHRKYDYKALEAELTNARNPLKPRYT